MEMLEEHPLLARIEAALDTVRPYLLADGGNVKIVEINENNHVKITFLGACSSCSMSAMTFRAGIEEAIKRIVPEVSTVEAVSELDFKN